MRVCVIDCYYCHDNGNRCHPSACLAILFCLTDLKYNDSVVKISTTMTFYFT